MKRKYQGNKRVQRAQLQTLRGVFEILEMKIGKSVNAGEDMLDVNIIEKSYSLSRRNSII